MRFSLQLNSLHATTRECGFPHIRGHSSCTMCDVSAIYVTINTTSCAL
jgi:hypothetical protein